MTPAPVALRYITSSLLFENNLGEANQLHIFTTFKLDMRD